MTNICFSIPPSLYLSLPLALLSRSVTCSGLHFAWKVHSPYKCFSFFCNDLLLGGSNFSFTAPSGVIAFAPLLPASANSAMANITYSPPHYVHHVPFYVLFIQCTLIRKYYVVLNKTKVIGCFLFFLSYSLIDSSLVIWCWFDFPSRVERK